MTVTIPILDILFWLLLSVVSAFAIYQGWRICLTGKVSFFFTDLILIKIAELLGNGKEYRKKTLNMYNLIPIKIYGYLLLFGGVFGFCSGVTMIYITISKIIITKA